MYYQGLIVVIAVMIPLLPGHKPVAGNQIFLPRLRERVASRQDRGGTGLCSPSCPAPRFFVETGQVQRRIISWELARGVRGNLTRQEL